MSIVKTAFGTTKCGKNISLYTIKNANGMEASVCDFGALLVKLIVPDKSGVMEDVVLGFDTLEEYEDNPFYFGAVIGRNANRIRNACFELDGVKYQLPVNENGNNLHTDYDNGFHKKVWDAELCEKCNSVKFSYESPEGENGFPGKVKMSVTYSLLDDNSIKLTYDGISDKKTVLNVSNHSYFNIGGHTSGSIVDEIVTLNADAFLPVDKEGIPVEGIVMDVAGTPMDFRTGRRISDDIDSEWAPLASMGGYDHNWAVNDYTGSVRKAAEIIDEKSGRKLEVFTDMPGIQLYVGNFLTPIKGKGGVTYDYRHALCLETQYFPDSISVPAFVQPVLEAGEKYHSETTYKFGIVE